MKATKSHILSRGPRTACHHCGQTLTIEHMLLECAVLRECRGEYNAVDSLNALIKTIPETCIVESLREARFFYLIWCNLSTSTSPETWTIWSDLNNLFREWKQLWDTFTCVGQLICPEGRVSSLNKSNPTNQCPIARPCDLEIGLSFHMRHLTLWQQTLPVTVLIAYIYVMKINTYVYIYIYCYILEQTQTSSIFHLPFIESTCEK